MLAAPAYDASVDLCAQWRVAWATAPMLLLGGAAVTPRLARAQDNAAAVEALFEEGKRLEAKGDYAGACPKFLSSYNLEHRIGTLLNLAYCYEENRQLASAWARFVQARALAVQLGRRDKGDFAAQHAAALEPRLSKLVIVVPPGSAAPGMLVMRDGTLVDPPQYGVAVPVDAGDHVVEATAPGKQPWKDTVHVGADAVTSSIEVPPLAEVQAAAPVPLPVPTALATPPQSSPAAAPGPAAIAMPLPETPRGLGTRKTIGLGLAGAGVAGVVTGTVFGLLTKSAIDAQSRDCPSSAHCNPGQAAIDHQTWQTDGTVSTVAFIAGGALLATGALLFFVGGPSQPPAASSSLVVAPVVGRAPGLGVGGTF